MNGNEPAPSESWLRRRLLSFVYAGYGVWRLTREPNARIHFVVATLVIAAGFVLHLAAGEWALLVLAITSVLVAEALNTAVESLANATMPERHPLVGAAKDLAAGAVLLAAAGAAVVGVLVLGPHLLALVMERSAP